jgi:hypothetical protein
MPFREEGPRDLRIGKAMTLVQDWLKTREPDSDFSWQIDFTLVTSMQRQLGLIDDRTELSIIDFVHPVWVHGHGTCCSNCLVPIIEGPEMEPENETSDDDAITLHPDSAYPSDLSEALRDADDAPFVVDRDVVCPVCGDTFTLLEYELSNTGIPYACPDCRDPS